MRTLEETCTYLVHDYRRGVSIHVVKRRVDLLPGDKPAGDDDGVLGIFEVCGKHAQQKLRAP